MSPETYEIFDRINVKTGLKEKYKKEGREEGKQEAALKMLQKGYQAQEVADILEIPVPWIESLTE